MKISYADYDPDGINETFLSLQECMESALSNNGGNNDKPPNLNKSHLARNGSFLKNMRRNGDSKSLAFNLLNEDK